MSHGAKSGQMQSCIDSCRECEQRCLETQQHCLALGGEHASKAHITLLSDCAEICATNAAFMIRESSLHGKTCAACAAVCDACAKSCESIGGSDATMKRCAEVCRKCAESCRQMAA